jgi:hypothetical protein
MQRYITVHPYFGRHLADEIKLGHWTCQQLLNAELGTTFVARILTADQKQQNVVSEELHQIASDNATFLSRVITSDVSWIYGYDPETKQQSSQWKSPNSPELKNSRQANGKVNIMLIIFFDI